MMIFDHFTNLQSAQKFAETVEKKFPRQATVYTSPDDAHKADPFPLKLEGIVVHVSRVYEAIEENITIERKIANLVEQFQGVFVGT